MFGLKMRCRQLPYLSWNLLFTGKPHLSLQVLGLQCISLYLEPSEEILGKKAQPFVVRILDHSILKSGQKMDYCSCSSFTTFTALPVQRAASFNKMMNA